MFEGIAAAGAAGGEMDEDQVFTKRFIECVKKTEEERNEQVRALLPHLPTSPLNDMLM